jgi:glucose/mannose transport system substrate-binding protein
MNGLWKSLAVVGAIGGFAVPAIPAVAIAQDKSVEVFHFNTSGSEAKAWYQYKDKFEEAGGTWIDSPVAGGGGDAHDTTLRARVLAGDGPGAAMPKCPEAARWFEEGYIVNLDEVAAAEGWDDKLPALIKSFAKVGDHYVCVPYDVHRLDWLWGSAEVLKEAGFDKMPATWEEFDAIAAAVQAKGKIVLAHGGEEWQDGTIFQDVAVGFGGTEFIEQLAEGNEDAIRGDAMRKTLERYRILSTLLDRGSPGRPWNLAAAMVSNGEAAFQIMGDWAKGEFILAGKTPGVDILCAPVPGDVADRPGMIMVSNALAFFTKTKGETTASEGQKLLAATLLKPDAEFAYTQYKGSIPSIMGVDPAAYDACAQISMADLAKNNAGGTLTGDLWTMHSAPPAIAAAIRETTSRFFNSPSMSVDEGIDLIAEAVDLAK